MDHDGVERVGREGQRRPIPDVGVDAHPGLRSPIPSPVDHRRGDVPAVTETPSGM
jgi:hypothetical protein